MCCGNKTMRPNGAFRPATDFQRQPAAQIRRPAAQLAKAAPSFFEHVGAGTLVVNGPVSGRQYRFEGQGATTVIDPRDRVSLKAIPFLRELRR